MSCYSTLQCSSPARNEPLSCAPHQRNECTSRGRVQRLSRLGNGTGFRIGGLLQDYACDTTQEYSKLYSYKKCKAYPQYLGMKPQSVLILSQTFTNCYGMLIKRQPRASLMAGSQPAAMLWSASILKTEHRYNQGSVILE